MAINHTHIKVEEIWKTIECAPEYAVSNFGNVRRETNGMTTHAGRILRASFNKPSGEGYLSVMLRVQRVSIRRYVHRLVAIAFLGNRAPDCEVNHIDGNRLNNRADNLEWVTSKENKAHAIAAGLMNNKGSNHGISKLTEDQVVEIRQAFASGATMTSQAVKFGVCVETISRVVKRKGWIHI